MMRMTRRVRQRFVVCLLACWWALLPVLPLQASPFADVPAGHWTYTVLEQLSAARLIDGYAPGFFSGARRLTRYEMALSLAGALERLIGAGGWSSDDLDDRSLAEIIKQYNSAHPDESLSAGDSELLRAGLLEFTPELEVLGYDVPALEPWQSTDNTWQLDPSIDYVARQLLRSDVGPATPLLSGKDSFNGIATGDADGPRLQVGVERGTFVVDLRQSPPIARIGSTLLHVSGRDGAPTDADKMRKASPALDGTIHLSDQRLPGLGVAVAFAEQDDDKHLPVWQMTERRTGIDGFVIAPSVSLSGHRAHRTSAEGEMRATQVHAQVMLGDVSIDGKLQSVEQEFLSALPTNRKREGGESLGLGLTLRLGEVSVSAGRDVVQRRTEGDPERVTSWTLEYGLPDFGSVKAGWQSISDTRERTSVDLNVPVPQGAIHVGLAYEGARDAEGAGISMTTLTMAGLDLRLKENTEARAAFSVLDSAESSERTTSLGLRYSLNSEAALLLGYKLIDFAEEYDRQNVTTAEFSIRF